MEVRKTGVDGRDKPGAPRNDGSETQPERGYSTAICKSPEFSLHNQKYVLWIFPLAEQNKARPEGRPAEGERCGIQKASAHNPQERVERGPEFF